MAIFKHTLIGEGLGHGYSESLYFELAGDNLDAAIALVAGVKDKRRPLLGKEHYLKGERVAMIYNDAGEKVTNIAQPFKFYLPGNQSQRSAESNISLQILFTNASKSKKKLGFMFGPYNALFPFGDAFVDDGSTAFASNFQSWRSLLITLGMGWMSSPTTQKRKITGYVFDPVTGLTTYTLEAPGLNWPNTDKPVAVSVEFPLSRSPLDGRQLITHTNATTATTAKPRPAQPFTTPGVMTIHTPQLIKLNTPAGNTLTGNIIPQNPVSRKRGRPLLVSRGRAPVISRW